MRNLLAQVVMSHASGFAEDQVVNTFAILAQDDWAGDGGDELEITGPLSSFYNAVPAGAVQSLNYWLSKGLTRVAGAHKFRFFDVTDHLDGSPHGSPFAEVPWTLGPSEIAAPMPEEVALCLTLRSGGWAGLAVEAPDGPDAGFNPDRPRQRRTGRVYVGPWNVLANTGDAANRSRPHADVVTALVNAGAALVTGLQANGHSLCVWSRTGQAFYPLDGSGFDPGAVQVDNAWDTQRRRGVDPTLRTTIAV